MKYLTIGQLAKKAGMNIVKRLQGVVNANVSYKEKKAIEDAGYMVT